MYHDLIVHIQRTHHPSGPRFSLVPALLHLYISLGLSVSLFLSLCASFSSLLLCCYSCPPVSSLTPVLPHSATCFPSCCSLRPTFLTVLNIRIFLHLSSRSRSPLSSPGYGVSIPATVPSAPLCGTTRWLYFPSALSSSALLVPSCSSLALPEPRGSEGQGSNSILSGHSLREAPRHCIVLHSTGDPGPLFPRCYAMGSPPFLQHLSFSYFSVSRSVSTPPTSHRPRVSRNGD